MPKIRVLVVDDAVIVRSRVSKLLSADEELEVVGVAANGRIALAKIPQVNPDVIILDVEMPEMNGLETLTFIRQTYPKLPVIMFSTFTVAGAAATLDALALGATDYSTKPSNLGSIEAANQHILEDLVPKIKFFGSRSQTSTITVKTRTTTQLLSQRVDILAIGVSTGGPQALSTLLSNLPADFPVPILIVQHMPAMFTKLLAERLTSKCQIQVKEAVAGVVLTSGNAWIAPGDFHMVVLQDGEVVRIGIHKTPPENSCRPSVDVLFRSVAEVYQQRSLAVVLTGMGQDGLRGCELIHEVGGQILAQDKDSSVVWGMPRFVINAKLADGVIALNQMADEVKRRVGHNR